MINEAMFYSKDQINPFTEALRDICGKEGSCLVRLRNDFWREVIYKPADIEEDEQLDQGFRTEDWSMVWNIDGSSLTSKDYDMIEIREKSWITGEHNDICDRVVETLRRL